jgi:two-component sensor histidine kinase
MKVNIKFKDDKLESVESALLDDLIAIDEIKMFQRSGGWVQVGSEPVRGWGGTYDGNDRRINYQFSVPDRMDYLTSEVCITNKKKSLISICSFEELFESAPGLFLVLDPDLKIVAVSDSYLDATMTKRDNILGHNIFEIFPDNPDEIEPTGVKNLKASLNRVIRTGTADKMAIQKYDVRQASENGGKFVERFWSPVNSPVLNYKNELKFIIHRVEDVTDYIHLQSAGVEKDKINEVLRERIVQMEAEIYTQAKAVADSNMRLKEALEQVEKLLKEKETLMRETHHRVKNNLSIISSLLSLQLEESGSKEAENVLNDSINRIRAMSIIHEKLYKGQNLGNINVNDYFSELGNILTMCYEKDNCPLTFKTDISENMFMKVGTVVPLGLVFNELCTNSLKYAFDGNSSGRINLKIFVNNDKAVFEYSDSGKGYDINSFVSSDKFGLQLISMLVEQLHGEIKWSNENGVRCTISFSM